MVPVEFEPPGNPLTNQVTVVLLAFWTVAVNCRESPMERLADRGEMVMLTSGGGGEPFPPAAQPHATIRRSPASNAYNLLNIRNPLSVLGWGSISRQVDAKYIMVSAPVKLFHTMELSRYIVFPLRLKCMSQKRMNKLAARLGQSRAATARIRL